MRHAVALLFLGLPLTACGGASMNAVAKAATTASSAGSEHVVFKGAFAAAGKTVEMSGTGDFQASPRLGHIHMAMSVAGKSMAMDEVVQGTHFYLRSPVFGAMAGGKRWVTFDLAKMGQKLGVNLSSYTVQDPTDILTAMKKAGSVTKIGSDTIDGIDTTHFSATIDLAKLAKSQKVEKTLPALKAVPMDIWVDGDNQLRRMSMRINETVSGQTIKSNLRMDLSNYGEQVSVHVPKASETFDMTSLGG